MKSKQKELYIDLKTLVESIALFNEAASVSSTDFLNLIKKVTALHKNEQKIANSTKVSGRLFQLCSLGKATIVGDLHGDLNNLIQILNSSDFLRKAQKDGNTYLVFLGDYGDRGLTSSEVYYVVLRLKEMFPDQVILMRGNHEGPEDMLPSPNDLPTQLKQRFSEEAGTKIMFELRKLFKHLYTAVIIEERAVLIHGGIPSRALSIRDLAYAHEKHPKETHLEEMLWSDPQENLKGVLPSPRGAGRLFGSDITKRILKLFNVKVLIRGHEQSPEGYKINHDGKVLTLFSTNKPPYSNKYATYLQIDLSKKIKNAQQLKEYIRRVE